MEPTYFTHVHNGGDSPRISGGDLINSPQAKPTTASVAVLTTGGTAVLQTSDSAIIENLRTRQNEIEAILRNLKVII